MTQDDFIAGLDRYGSDLSRWPSALRKDAEMIIQQKQGEAYAQYRAVCRLDAVLGTSTPAGRVLLDRILLVAQQVPERFSLLDLFSVWQRRVMAGAVCASLMGGVVVGVIAPAQSTTSAMVVASADDIYDEVPGLTWSPGDVGGL